MMLLYLFYAFIFGCSVGFEPLGDEGVCSIASALKENSTLIDLSYVTLHCTDVISYTCSQKIKFGSLAVCLSLATTKIKPANIFHSHI